MAIKGKKLSINNKNYVFTGVLSGVAVILSTAKDLSIDQRPLL